MRLWDNPRTLPRQKPALNNKGKRKNKFTQKQIKEAKSFYKAEYKSWNSYKKKSVIKNLKWYDALILKNKGFTLGEIAFREKTSISTATAMIRQTEARIDYYLKIKENRQ